MKQSEEPIYVDGLKEALKNTSVVFPTNEKHGELHSTLTK
jgi:hypothetical protein